MSEEASATQTAYAASATASSWIEAATATHTLDPTFTSTPTSTPSQTPTPTKTSRPTRRPTVTIRATQTPAASPWDRYEPRTLKEIIEATKNEAEALMDNSMYLNHGDDVASKVEVIYTEEFREIPSVKLMVIITWLRTWVPQLSDSQRADLFKMEGKFIEGDTVYWLPVQDQLIPYMEDELKKDDKVTLLLVWAGMTNFSDEVEWIFLVNNFPVTTP